MRKLPKVLRTIARAKYERYVADAARRSFEQGDADFEAGRASMHMELTLALRNARGAK